MARHYKGNGLTGPTQYVCVTKRNSELLIQHNI